MPIKKKTKKTAEAPRKIRKRRKTARSSVKNTSVRAKNTSTRNAVDPRELRREQIAKTQRKRRKKRKRNYTLYYIILAFFLVVAGVTLSMTVFFNIENIKVEGSTIYTFDDVDSIIDAEVGDNLLRLNTNAMGRELLEEFEKADAVEVKRAFPTTLLIRIDDGEPTTQLYSGDVYYVLSKTGRVLEHAETSMPNVPVIVGPDAKGASLGSYVSLTLENQERDWIKILFDEIEKSGLNDISAIDITNTISLKIYYQNRFQINLGSLSELDTKLSMVYEVFATDNIGVDESGIIDITDPDRLYVDSDAELELAHLFSDGWSWTNPHVEAPEAEVTEEETSAEEVETSSQPEE